jgi:hypothetical protein
MIKFVHNVHFKLILSFILHPLNVDGGMSQVIYFQTVQLEYASKNIFHIFGHLLRK